MLNILLVDDEYIVLKGLEILLNSQTEVELTIKTAMDAVDALHQLSAWKPDVIIADINMPEIDGLTMLEKVSETLPSCRFLIISGYEDQEYLRRALKLHVDDYLLKPVDKVYLIRRLKEISGQKEHRINNALAKCRLLLFKGQAAANPGFSGQELSELLPWPRLTLFTANLDSANAIPAQRRLSGYFEQICVLSQNNWSVFLLNYSAGIQAEDIRSILKDALPESISGLSVFPEGPVTDTLIHTLPFHYQQALCDMLLCALPVEARTKENMLRLTAQRTLTPAIRVITFEQSAGEYINGAYDNSLDPADNFLLAFTEILAAYILIADINLPVPTIKKLYQSHLAAVHNSRSLCASLEKIRSLGYELYTPAGQAGPSSKTDAACRYIQEHFRQDIALEEVADFVSVNPSYLSFLFKKETGVTFLQYLTNIRLQKACELMSADSGLSLEAVSAACGYHSASYFHKIFRAKFGVSPRQWMLGQEEGPPCHPVTVHSVTSNRHKSI